MAQIFIDKLSEIQSVFRMAGDTNVPRRRTEMERFTLHGLKIVVDQIWKSCRGGLSFGVLLEINVFHIGENPPVRQF